MLTNNPLATFSTQARVYPQPDDPAWLNIVLTQPIVIMMKFLIICWANVRYVLAAQCRWCLPESNCMLLVLLLLSFMVIHVMLFDIQ